MAEQLPLIRSARLPFVVRRRKVRKAASRALCGFAAASDNLFRERDGFEVRALAEDEALLAELRVRCRAAARGMRGRPSARCAAAYAVTTEGRRVHQLMDELSERIARRSLVLCA